MTKRDLIEHLADFPDDKEILIWLDDDQGLIKTNFIAENISEDENNGAAVIYLDDTV